MIRRFLPLQQVFVILLLLLTGFTSLHADEKTKNAKLQELMKLQGLFEMLEQQQNTGSEQAKAIGANLIQEFKKQLPDLEGPVLDEINAAYIAFIDSVKPAWTSQEAVAMWCKVYGDQVSEAELDQIIAFYKSPIGQKDILATKTAMPKWTAFFAQKAQQSLEKPMNAYIERLKEIIRRATAKPRPKKAK